VRTASTDLGVVGREQPNARSAVPAASGNPALVKPISGAPPQREPARAPAGAGGAADDIAHRLAPLQTLDLAGMRREWRRLYRAEPPRMSRDLLMRALAYRIQEIAFGGLSKATQRRFAALASAFESDGRIAAPRQPRIKPGARLVREWHGRTHTVVVTADGLEFEGRLYRSLTCIAREITGARWSGPRFFGLAKTAATSGGDNTEPYPDTEANPDNDDRPGRNVHSESAEGADA